MPTPIISYIRVSTDKQSKSGLGLEAQRDAIARFAFREALEMAGEFIERSRPAKVPTRWKSALSLPQRCARPSRPRRLSLFRNWIG